MNRGLARRHGRIALLGLVLAIVVRPALEPQVSFRSVRRASWCRHRTLLSYRRSLCIIKEQAPFSDLRSSL
jgi:hypothetical protein